MPEAPFAPYSIAAEIIRLSPGPLATWAIEQLGHNALQSLGWGCVAVTLVLGFLLGKRSALLFGVLAFLLTLLAARIDPMDVHVGPTLLSAAVAGAAAWLTALMLAPRDEGVDADPTRRRLIAGAALASLFYATSAGALVRRQTEKAPSGPVRADTRAVLPADSAFEELPSLSPRVTPTAQHYLVDINLDDPHVGGDGWRLHVKGEVDNELSFSLNELRAMRTTEVLLVMQCISNNVGGRLIGNARWTGVPTAALLDMARPKPDRRSVLARSVDGYTDVIALDALQRGEAMVAFGMNGSLLPRGHGFPARLLYPGHYGMRSVKWLKELVLLDHEEQGYWAQRGWDKEALMRTAARIDVPKSGNSVSASFTAGGIAWAGDRRISKVELSTDDGASWQEAQLERELFALSWRRWQIDLQLAPGEHHLLVRAYDGSGAVQDAKERAPHPSGSSGYHSIRVIVG